MYTVTFPVRALVHYGVKDCSSPMLPERFNLNFRRATLCSSKDHINFMGVNPLRGNGG